MQRGDTFRLLEFLGGSLDFGGASAVLRGLGGLATGGLATDDSNETDTELRDWVSDWMSVTTETVAAGVARGSSSLLSWVFFHASLA